MQASIKFMQLVPKNKNDLTVTDSRMPPGTNFSLEHISWSKALIALRPRERPPLEYFPTSTVAFVSMLILRVSGPASAWAFICRTFSKIALVSAVFLGPRF
jgi:hypothetical protein